VAGALDDDALDLVGDVNLSSAWNDRIASLRPVD
jgi:hypothetical protein